MKPRRKRTAGAVLLPADPAYPARHGKWKNLDLWSAKPEVGVLALATLSDNLGKFAMLQQLKLDVCRSPKDKSAERLTPASAKSNRGALPSCYQMPEARGARDRHAYDGTRLNARGAVEVPLDFSRKH